jgi:two-component system, sensor histidine kinase ChiS
MLANISLSKDFKIFSILTLLILCFFSAIITGSIYYSMYLERKNNYNYEAERIDEILTETFDYITHYTNFLGEKIIENNSNNPQFIADLIYSNPNNTRPDLYSWTLFYWINTNNQMTISSNNGILPSPLDVSDRQYINEVRLHPWKIHFSNPIIGYNSGELILPAGFGITDNKGKYYGTIGTGFNLTRLNNRLTRAITKDGIDYILISQDLNFISSSLNITSDAANILLKDIRFHITHHSHDNFIDEDVNYNHNNLIYYIKSTKYPFYIVISDDNKLAVIEFLRTAMPRIIELLIIGIFFVTILYFFRRRIIKPISSLYGFAKKIANNENITTIAKSEYTEINLLAEQLEEISAIKHKLIIAQELEKKANEILEQKVFDRTKELEHALKIKTEFLNNLSHEVRTPIQGVTALSSGLIEHWENFDNNKKYEISKQIDNNAKRLFSLVNDILDLSRFAIGKVVLNKKNVNITQIINDVIEECKPLFEYKNAISVNFLANNINYYIYGDEIKITQVIRNLLSNAIKFTPQGKIIINIKENDNNIEVTISDEGIGIPTNELEDIFLSFRQSSRTNKNAGGTGLGLAICREIIEAHNGKIWAENNAIGTDFKFTLLKYKDNKTENEISENKKINILMIDDEPTCLISMEMILYNSNYNLKTIDNPKDGLDFIHHNYNNIDIIMLDIMMPEINGFEVLKEIKQNGNLAHLPVILQSGVYNDDNLIDNVKQSIAGFLMKPYTKENVLKILKQIHPK